MSHGLHGKLSSYTLFLYTLKPYGPHQAQHLNDNVIDLSQPTRLIGPLNPTQAQQVFWPTIPPSAFALSPARLQAGPGQLTRLRGRGGTMSSQLAAEKAAADRKTLLVELCKYCSKMQRRLAARWIGAALMRDDGSALARWYTPPQSRPIWAPLTFSLSCWLHFSDGHGRRRRSSPSS